MKYATVTVALAGVVAAADSWNTWTEKKPVDPTTTWDDDKHGHGPDPTWDPKHPKPTWDPEHPEPTWDPEHPEPTWDPEHPEPTWDPKHPKPDAPEGWYEWDYSKGDKPATWDDWKYKADPATSTWEDWETYATPAPTTGKCSYVTDIATTKCRKGYSNQCWPVKVHTTIYADECTWSDWKDPAAKTTEWNEWEAIETPSPSASCSYKEYVVKKCKKEKLDECYEKTYTKTVYPTDCVEWTKTPVAVETTWVNYPVDDKTTWYGWDSTTTVKSTVTETKTWNSWETVKTPEVVTKVLTPEWSKDGWFGPAWPTAKSGECVKNVVTSYGAAIWKPVPEPSSWSTYKTPEADTTWSTYKTPEADPTWSTYKTPEADTTWSTYKTPEADPTWSTYKTPEAETTTTWATAVIKTPVADKTWAPIAPKPDGKGHAPYAPNGNKWSMTYTPYNSKGKCKTEEVIKADIVNIAKLGFTSVRVYSTDCKTLEYVGKACRDNGLKIILGVFISKTGVAGADQQVKDIIAWAQWDLVELIVIGNESIYQGFCKVEDLVWFIKDCKTKFAAAGYTGSCTTTEPLGQWQKSGKEFCEVVDVVSANLYAYFNTECTAEGAGEFISAQITILEGICSKDVYVMESGWPSAGKANGAAIPGKEQQKTAIKSIQEKCGAKISFFSYENEQWKQPGQFGVEQYWGCADVFGQVDYPKSDDDKSSWSKW